MRSKWERLLSVIIVIVFRNFSSKEEKIEKAIKYEKLREVVFRKCDITDFRTRRRTFYRANCASNNFQLSNLENSVVSFYGTRLFTTNIQCKTNSKINYAYVCISLSTIEDVGDLFQVLQDCLFWPKVVDVPKTKEEEKRDQKLVDNYYKQLRKWKKKYRKFYFIKNVKWKRNSVYSRRERI